MKDNKSASLFPKEQVIESLKQSFVKLNPRMMIKNPIMFTVEVATVVMLLVTLYSIVNSSQGSFAYNIAGIMGQAAVETARQVAHVKCSGTCEKAKEEYIYTGVEDCEMLPFVPNGGAKTCTYGCCGFGSCVKVCPFDAIHIVDGIAVVDKEACKACGKCVAKCPRHLIELIPYDQKVAVDCSSHDKGKQVMDACEIGCIGCKKCEKTCPNGAITVEDFCAHIDYEKCTGCGACKEACPRGVIREA